MFDKKLSGTTTIQKKGESDKVYKSRLLQQTAKVVCGNCNNGWMSGLESRTKPLLSKMLFDLQHTGNLGKEEQNLIAFWAQKTTLMLALATRADYKIPQETYDDLFKQQGPIKEITVRVGWRIPKKGKYGPQLCHFTIGEVTGPEKSNMVANVGNFEVWRAIIAIGNIVFHLNGSTNNIQVEVGNVDKRVTPQIFPYEEDLVWPPEWPVDALTSIGFEEFSAV